jgi:glycosyltransferase involved in cell wall biosynthesis
VDVSRFYIDAGNRDALRRQYTPFGSEDVVLLELSKYSLVKNKSLPVRALALLPPRFKLLVCGPLHAAEQALFDELSQLVDRLGVRDRVVLQHGFVAHPENYYRLSDVFLFPSVSDGLGTPVLEAVACGIPVVAHRLPGVTDAWLEEGRSGILAAATPEAFAAAIQRALEIPREALEREAGELRRKAGADVIDAGYLSLLLDNALPA